MVQLLLALLLALPAYHRDQESPLERQARMQTVAQAIDSATLEATCTGAWRRADWCKAVWPGTRAELAALLVTIGFHESTFALHVGAGACGEHECDHGQARSYWQVHRHWFSSDEWAETDGAAIVPVTRSAVGAARALGEGRRRCRSVEGAIAFYARPAGCTWSGVERRMRTYRTLVEGLH